MKYIVYRDVDRPVTFDVYDTMEQVQEVYGLVPSELGALAKYGSVITGNGYQVREAKYHKK